MKIKKINEFVVKHKDSDMALNVTDKTTVGQILDWHNNKIGYEAVKITITQMVAIQSSL